MRKKVKIPKPSDKELKELTQAVQFAFGNPDADAFFDEVMRRVEYFDRVFDALKKRSSTK